MAAPVVLKAALVVPGLCYAGILAYGVYAARRPLVAHQSAAAL